MTKVSIVIPVYGVEKYIEQCVRTLFGQTLREIEYVFVDDCSPDKSIEIMQRVLEEFPERKAWVKLIRHETNQGVGAARNHGIAACTGEYVIHCDPDDWVELDMYEKMYNKAKETDADMVYCSYVYEHPNGKTYYAKMVSCDNPITFLNQMYAVKQQGYLWNKLYKREIALHESIKSPDDIVMCEDFLRNTFMLSLCKNILAIDRNFYHYQFVQSSITQRRDDKQVRKRLESMKKICAIIENDFIDNSRCDDWRVFVLRKALREVKDKKFYRDIFPEFQANLGNIKLRFDRKLPLIIARYNITGGRWIDIFLVKIKQIILKLI